MCRHSGRQACTHTQRSKQAGRQTDRNTGRQAGLLISIKTANKSQQCSCQVYPGTLNWVGILPQGIISPEVLNQKCIQQQPMIFLLQLSLGSTILKEEIVIKFLSWGLRNTVSLHTTISYETKSKSKVLITNEHPQYW